MVYRGSHETTNSATITAIALAARASLDPAAGIATVVPSVVDQTSVLLSFTDADAVDIGASWTLIL